MEIISKPIKEDNYFTTEYTKTQIYLHHTVSSNATGVLSWWDQDDKPIATAYVVDKDGKVYQTYNPKYWAYHLGLKYIQKGYADKRSIGIEIVNEGGLIKKENGNMYWFDGKVKYKGEYIGLDEPWRGYKYFAKYSPDQIKSVIVLVQTLSYYFDIPLNVITHMDFDKDLAMKHKGILSHCNVREDKSDISPAFSLTDFANYVSVRPIQVVELPK